MPASKPPLAPPLSHPILTGIALVDCQIEAAVARFSHLLTPAQADLLRTGLADMVTTSREGEEHIEELIRAQGSDHSGMQAVAGGDKSDEGDRITPSDSPSSDPGKESAG